MKKIVSIIFTLFTVVLGVNAEEVTFGGDNSFNTVTTDDQCQASASWTINGVGLYIECPASEEIIEDGYLGGLFNTSDENFGVLAVYNSGLPFVFKIAVPEGKFVKSITLDVDDNSMFQNLFATSSVKSRSLSNPFAVNLIDGNKVVISNEGFVTHNEIILTLSEDDYDYFEINEITVEYGEYLTDVVLSDSEDYPYMGKNIYAKSVSYSRNMTSQWAPLCLPFEFTTQDSDNFDVYFLDTQKNGEYVFNKYNPNTTIAAGKLVFVRRHSTANSITISAKNVLLTSDGFTNGIKSTRRKSLGAYVDFTGNLKKVKMSNGIYFSSDQLYIAEGYEVTMKPYRGWIGTDSNAVLARLRNLDLNDELSLTTSVNEIESFTNSEETYNINGSKTTGLVSGINIIKSDNTFKKIYVK